MEWKYSGRMSRGGKEKKTDESSKKGKKEKLKEKVAKWEND